LNGERTDRLDVEAHRTIVKTALDLLDLHSEPRLSLRNEVLTVLEASPFLHRIRHDAWKRRRS
jgi:hypothetical protein